MAHEAARRRRAALGLPPLEVEEDDKLGMAIESHEPAPLPISVGQRAITGVDQSAAILTNFAGSTAETVGGLLPGSLETYGQDLQKFGESIMPEHRLEGFEGALLEGAVTLIPSLWKIGAVGKVASRFLTPAALSMEKTVKAFTDQGMSLEAAAAAATTKIRATAMAQGAATFGMLGAAESAGMQKARQGDIEWGEVLKASGRGALTGGVWETFAPYNVLGRVMGLGAYGGLEAAAFGEDPLSGALHTAGYAALGGAKGQKPLDTYSHLMHPIKVRREAARKKAEAALAKGEADAEKTIEQVAEEVRAEDQNRTATEIVDKVVANIAEVFEAAKRDPNKYADAVGSLNRPGAVEHFAEVTYRDVLSEHTRAGVEPKEAEKVATEKSEAVRETLEAVRDAHSRFVDSQTLAMGDMRQEWTEMGKKGKVSPEDVAHIVAVERDAIFNAMKSGAMTPELADSMIRYAVDGGLTSKKIRARMKAFGTKMKYNYVAMERGLKPERLSIIEMRDLLASADGHIGDSLDLGNQHIQAQVIEAARRKLADAPESAVQASTEAFAKAMEKGAKLPAAKEIADKVFQAEVARINAEQAPAAGGPPPSAGGPPPEAGAPPVAAPSFTPLSPEGLARFEQRNRAGTLRQEAQAGQSSVAAAERYVEKLGIKRGTPEFEVAVRSLMEGGPGRVNLTSQIAGQGPPRPMDPGAPLANVLKPRGGAEPPMQTPSLRPRREIDAMVRAKAQRESDLAVQSRAADVKQFVAALGVKPGTEAAETVGRVYVNIGPRMAEVVAAKLAGKVPSVEMEMGRVSELLANPEAARANIKEVKGSGFKAEAEAQATLDAAEARAYAEAIDRDLNAHKAALEKGIKAELNSTKVETERSSQAAAARLAAEGIPHEPVQEMAPRPRVQALMHDVLGPEKGAAMVRLMDVLFENQARKNGLPIEDAWEGFSAQTGDVREHILKVVAGAAKAVGPGVKFRKGQILGLEGKVKRLFVVSSGGSQQMTKVSEVGGAHGKLSDIMASAAGSELLLYKGTLTDGIPRGMTEFMADGQAVITAFEGFNVSTAVHELAHVFRRQMSGTDIEFLKKQMGVTGEKFPVVAEERFAKAFEKWLMSGVTTKPEMVPHLDQFKSWMAEVYDAAFPGGRAAAGSAGHPSFKGIELSKPMADFFENMFHYKELRDADLGTIPLWAGSSDAAEMGGPSRLYQSSSLPFEAPTVAKNLYNEVTDKVMTGRDAALAAIKQTTKWYLPYVDAIRSYSEAFGQRFVKSNDNVRPILGQFSPILIEMGETTHGIKASFEVSNDLLKFHKGGTTANAHIRGYWDGTAPMDGIRARSRKMISLGKSARNLQADLAEGKHALTKGAKLFAVSPHGEVLRYIGDRSSFPQLFTEATMQMIGRGSGNDYEGLVSAAVIENPHLKPREVRRRLDAIHRRVGVTRSVFELDHGLIIPTHAKINERWTQLLETNPTQIASKTMNLTSLRLGFLKEFGKTSDGGFTNGKFLFGRENERLLSEFAGRGAGADERRKILEATFRASNGIPVDLRKKGLPEVGSASGEVLKMVKFANSTLRSLALTRSAIFNVAEPLGNTLAFVDAPRLVRAYAEMAKDRDGWSKEMARTGAITPLLTDMIYEPGRAPESTQRIIRDWLGKTTLHMPMNEINELVSAIAGRLFKNDAMAGNLSARDLLKLKRLRFTEAEIKEFAEHKAGDAISPEKQALFDAIETRMPEATQGTTSLPNELSQAANSSWYNAFFFADRYNQMKFDRTIKEIGFLRDAMTSPEGKIQSPGREQAIQSATYFGGTAASGLASLFLGAFVMGGPETSAWMAQSEDDRFGLVMDTVKQSMVGGPMEMMRRSLMTENERSIGGQLVDMTFPGSVLQEFYDVFNGYGRYKNLTMAGKAVELLQARTPLSKPLVAWAAAVGYGADPEIAAAERAYWRWAKEEKPTGQFTLSERVESEEKKSFGIWMRRAFDYAKKGDIVAFSEAVDSAVENGADVASIRKSLGMKRMLNGKDFDESTAAGAAARASLRSRIGERAYTALLRRDELLEEVMDRLR